ncbi:hypothetical protein EGY14_00555 [Burkholderia pseudomallei]|nr:hypothetical protein EGY14_00555 [Burkholderia pseudomallei]
MFSRYALLTKWRIGPRSRSSKAKAAVEARSGRSKVRTPNPEPRTPNPEPRTLPARRAALRRLPRVRRARAARAQDQPHDFIGRRIERLRR